MEAMEKFLDRTKNFILAKQGGMISSTLILSLMLIISRGFGFLRYRILAGYFTKEELDIFLASFRVSDFIFEILITGALTSVFIPIFIKYQKNREDLNKNISSIINIIFIVLFIFISALFFCIPFLIPLITPGFSQEKNTLISSYSRILLIGQLPFLVLGNFLTGIGQANKMFILTAIAPIIYNIAIIITTLLFAQQFFLAAPLFGTVIGAFLLFLIQIPFLFISDYRYQPILRFTTGLKDFFRMVIPRVFTVAIVQIDATIDLTLTTLAGAGSYTIFYFAQHLQLLPVSVIGMAFGQASLPYLSEMFQEKRMDEMKKIIADSLVNLSFFTIPIMCIFIFARTPLVRLFFGGGKFDWDATVLTAVTLSTFSLSLPFHTVYYFLTRCFYALLDSRTPFFHGFLSVAVNAALSIYFIVFLKLPIWSLGISFSAAMILNVLLLVAILSKRLGGLNMGFMVKELIKISAASGVSAFAAYKLMKLLDGLIFDTTRTLNVFFLLATSTFVFTCLYLGLCWLLEVQEMYLITRLFTKAKEYHKKIVAMYNPL